MKQTDHLPGETDVLIVGGGPAGMAAAIVFARAGLRTLLCEKKMFPVDKACGEGIMPTGVTNLDQLGVTRYLNAATIYPFVGICYHTQAGQHAAASFAEGPGWGVRRTVLSAALLCRARELDCLEIRQSTVAKPVARKDGHVIVQVSNQSVLARLLVGADGLNSSVRRWASLDKRPLRRYSLLPPPQRWGARRHFQVAPWSDHVEVYWGEGIEAYVTPCGPEQVGVAFLWDRERYARRLQGGKNFFGSLLEAFPVLQAHLERADPIDQTRAIGPLYRQALAPVSDGVVLIGDAAGYLDAITGEGISLATAEALALEKTVVPLLQVMDQMPNAFQLAAYSHAYQAIVRPYYQLTWLALLLSRYPLLARRAIALLARAPDVFQYLLSANMGLVPLWSPHFGGRLLRRLLEHCIGGVAAQSRIFPGYPAGEQNSRDAAAGDGQRRAKKGGNQPRF